MTQSSPPRDRQVSSAARSSATVGVWTLVSRITGVGRLVVIAAVLGPTYFANVFASTNVVPNLVFGALAGPAVSMVLVPALVRALSTGGTPVATAVLGRVAAYLATAAGTLAALLVLASPGLAWALTLGVSTDQQRAHQLTLLMLIFVAPQVLLYTLAAIGAAAQQARGRFAVAAAAPALENIGLIGTLAAVIVFFDPGLDVGQIPVSLVVTLGIGSTLAVGLHAAAQLVGAARAGLPVRLQRGWRADPAAAEITARFRRSVGVTALPVLSYFLLILLAATVPGGVLVLQLAWAVYHLPTALGARAISTAVLPGLAKAVELGDRAAYASSWRRALSYVAVTSVPAACILVVFAGSIANILANGEMRGSNLTGSIAACIVVLGLSQIAWGALDLGKQALFARLDLRGPWHASVVWICTITIVGSCTLLLPSGHPRLVGLCLAVLVGDLAAATTILALVRSAIQPEPLVDLGRLASTALATVLMFPAVWLGYVLVETVSTSRWTELSIVVSTGALALGIFAIALRPLVRRWGGIP